MTEEEMQELIEYQSAMIIALQLENQELKEKHRQATTLAMRLLKKQVVEQTDIIDIKPFD